MVMEPKVKFAESAVIPTPPIWCSEAVSEGIGKFEKKCGQLPQLPQLLHQKSFFFKKLG